jgi:hypothetical protein
MTLAELRVWHWRRVLSYRDLEHACAAKAAKHERLNGGRCSYWRSKERNAYTRANWHIGAVQTLNDIPSLHATTAEQDCHLFPEPHTRRRKLRLTPPL